MGTQIRNYTYWKPFAPEFCHEAGREEDKLLLSVLNRSMMKGYRFNRQCPVCQYIVGFICPKLNLIIEIDGSAHSLKSKSANKKQDDLESLGYQVLRFSETDVAYQLDEVIKVIGKKVESFEKNCKISHPER